MWQIGALIFSIIGVLSLYVTNKHQKLVTRPAPLFWRKIGYGCLALSFVLWLQSAPVSSAIFTWIYVTITLLAVIPLATLLKRQE